MKNAHFTTTKTNESGFKYNPAGFALIQSETFSPLKYLLLFFVLISISSYSQDAKSIINKHIEALGGKQKLDAVTSFQFESTSDNKYAKGTSKIFYKTPGKWRKEYIENDKLNQLTIILGDKGWVVFDDGTINPQNGFSMIDDEFSNYLPGYILIAEKLGCKIVYSGLDDATKSYIIKITPPGSNTMKCSFTYYIDTSTNLVTQIIENTSMKSYTYLYDDYTLVAGIKIPLKVIRVDQDSNKQEVTTRTNVKVNSVLSDKLFEKPVLGKP